MNQLLFSIVLFNSFFIPTKLVGFMGEYSRDRRPNFASSKYNFSSRFVSCSQLRRILHCEGIREGFQIKKKVMNFRLDFHCSFLKRVTGTLNHENCCAFAQLGR